MITLIKIFRLQKYINHNNITIKRGINMKFEQEENLELNKIIEKKVKELKMDTKEDFVAHCVRKELGLKDPQ